jgi:hypothetical protein
MSDSGLFQQQLDIPFGSALIRWRSVDTFNVADTSFFSWGFLSIMMSRVRIWAPEGLFGKGDDV